MKDHGAYLGVGKQYLEDLLNPAGLLEVGNCSALAYEAQTNDIELPDYTNPGGGLDKSVTRITGVNVTYNARHFKTANVARALYGEVSNVDAGTVTGEAHRAFPTGLLLLKNPGASDLVIKAGAVTLVEGTDYVVGPAGLPTMKASANVPEDGVDVTVDYSYAERATVQALVASGKRFRSVFVGLNEAESGRPVIIEVFRINHSPASLSAIGDEFAGMEFTAKAEKDDSKSGQGVSQYMTVTFLD